MDMTLRDLIAQMQDGDHGALRTLYGQTSAKLFAVALRIVKRRALAEEVLQESFINIWSRCASYSPDKGSPLSWMATIVRNRAIDAVRRDREVVVDLDIEDYDQPDPGAQPGDRLFDAADAAVLARCLEQLSQDQRRMILAAYYEGCTHDALATASGVPLGTVKTWIRRGLLRLRECLQP